MAIVVPDETRPTPVKSTLSVLLSRLKATFSELKYKDISVIVSGSLHPPPDVDGLQALLSLEELKDVQVIAHEARHSELTDFGATSRQTPIAVNSHLARADLKIVIGQIDLHQFVGFTGGAKGVVIEAGAEKTIEHNPCLFFLRKMPG